MTDAGIPPRRIVSLVPSLTETLASFGLLERLVGRTRYCVEPAGTIESVEAVGGTKNPDVGRIVALAPDLVVVNEEENRLEDWQALVAAGLDVMVTHPRTVHEAVEMIEALGGRTCAARQARVLADECRSALESAAEQTRRQGRVRAFCPIWRNPWMTFRRDTYIGSVLDVVGLDNVFADGATAPLAVKEIAPAQRHADASDEGTLRTETPPDFFEIDVADALARDPKIIVLPDEPYVFGQKHGEELRALGAKGEIFYVDGRDLSWYGPRIPSALPRLLKITSDISHT